jgi:hypothetical protein
MSRALWAMWALMVLLVLGALFLLAYGYATSYLDSQLQLENFIDGGSGVG